MIKWLARLIEVGNEWVAARTSRAEQLEGKTAEYNVSLPLQYVQRQGRHGPKNLKHKRAREQWVCVREKEMFHVALGGQWVLIFLLSYPLASLAVLAVRWWIHCFLKFVCNHRLYALLSLISKGPAPCFSHLFFISHISPHLPLSHTHTLTHTLLLFIFFLPHLLFCIFSLLPCSITRSFKGNICDNRWLLACVFVHACTNKCLFLVSRLLPG